MNSFTCNGLPNHPVIMSATANNTITANDANPTTFFSLILLSSLKISANAIILPLSLSNNLFIVITPFIIVLTFLLVLVVGNSQICLF